MPNKPYKDQPRTSVYHLRVNAEERAAFDQLADRVGQKPSEVLRRLMREAVTRGPDFFADGVAEMRSSHQSLAAVGRNLNQLVKAANRGEVIKSSALREVLDSVQAEVESLSGIYTAAVDQARKRTVRRVRRAAQ